jgi:hypothetical protein
MDCRSFFCCFLMEFLNWKMGANDIEVLSYRMKLDQQWTAIPIPPPTQNSPMKDSVPKCFRKGEKKAIFKCFLSVFVDKLRTKFTILKSVRKKDLNSMIVNLLSFLKTIKFYGKT